VANHVLTLFGPTMDALLDHNAGLVPGGITANDLPSSCSSGSASGCGSGGSGPLSSQPAARRAILKTAASVSFGPTTPVPAPDGSPTQAATLPPPVATSPYPAWPPYPTFAFGSPMQHPAYATPAPQAPPPPPPAYSPPPPPPHYPSAPAAPGPAAPGSRREPLIKREPLNAKTLQRKADGHGFTFQPQHAWVAGADCATEDKCSTRSALPATRCRAEPACTPRGTVRSDTGRSMARAQASSETALATPPNGTATT
jgi:hypothetical protein